MASVTHIFPLFTNLSSQPLISCLPSSPISRLPCTQSCAHPSLTSTCSLPSFVTNLRFRNSRLSALPDDASGGSRGPGGSDSGGGSGGGDGSHAGGGDNSSFLSWYLAVLGKNPVAVKAITSAILTLIGDLICQLVIDQVRYLDLKRMFIFTLLGFVLVGPTLHFWYLYLSKLVTLPGALGALLRLVIDQFLFSPVFIAVFLATLVTLEGGPSQAIPKLKQEWFSSVVANWQLWIPFQFLNFRFVPQQFQVLAANVIALVWNVILSFKAHKVVQK
ncbi:protein sym-1-like isoform X1 [Arachis stenosperma]|uniref:protein sym-1-like isoform X1 n=1 Tax=Arachis stenosperma TaxID=217475 RepID=UPI0025ACE477|nr:protein sym-1-like isoform X1 [Arachis stenosperma]